MPACSCGFCKARRDGRDAEFLRLLVDVDIYGYRCGHPVTRRVRTLGHPFRGIRECANCYKVLEEPCR